MRVLLDKRFSVPSSILNVQLLLLIHFQPIVVQIDTARDIQNAQTAFFKPHTLWLKFSPIPKDERARLYSGDGTTPRRAPGVTADSEEFGYEEKDCDY
jgi:hypothetical protein